ncbi:DUF2878 domain-containing protein [Psychromonas sp. KJ10-10]|uniref:DUF2878 domain-containing protein n=1 Tax=Psychromonas sp. KJ10-10 TaxID=3391823 RepID=UPI0039B3EE74
MLNKSFSLGPRSFMVFNFISFQSSWLVAVNMQQQGLIILSIILASHFLVSPHRSRDWLTLLCITLAGCLVDFSFSYVNVFSFKDGLLLPLWLIFLWANFALTFHYSMAWLNRLPVPVQAVLGGVFGALSYYSAYKLGAVDYPFGEMLTIICLILIWSLTLPVYIFISLKIKDKYDEKNKVHPSFA